MSKRMPIPKIAYVCRALLAGEVLTIMDGFMRFRITNMGREVSRQIEQRFNVVVSKERVDFKTDIDMPGFYFRYRLNNVDYNEEGIALIRKYISAYFPEKHTAPSLITQSTLFQ